MVYSTVQYCIQYGMVQYITVRLGGHLASRPFLVFHTNPLLKHSAKYLADGDCQCHTVTKNMWGHLMSLASITHGSVYQPSLNGCTFKWQCPVRSPFIILSWFLLRLSNSPPFLAEGVLRKPVSCYILEWTCVSCSCSPFHSPINLCRYAKSRQRSSKWMRQQSSILVKSSMQDQW
jgi:hypothetical protein